MWPLTDALEPIGWLASPGVLRAKRCALRTATCAAGEGLVGLELPEAFGVRMAVTKVAQPEEGEIGEYDQEAEDPNEQQKGGKKEACEQPQWSFQTAKVGHSVAAGSWSSVGERHYIVRGLDWL